MVPAGVWVVSEEQQPDWRQTNAVPYGIYIYDWVTRDVFMDESEEVISTSTSCLFEVGFLKRVPYMFDEDDDSDWDLELEEVMYGCDFGNQFVPPVVDNDNDTSTRVGARNSGGQGRVLGAATSTNVCDGMFITSYMRMGQDNPVEQVYRLQVFLTVLGLQTPLTGIFDAATDAAVRAFQSRYVNDVLSPWGITDPTGYVFKTTRAKINNMVCPGSEPAPVI